MDIPVEVAGFPQPDVKWTLNDKHVTSSREVNIETKEKSSRLLVRKCAKPDAGKYAIAATNIVGSASAEFQVDIQGKFSFD